MAFLPALIGCGEPVKTPIAHAAQTAEPDADRVADEIRADPVRYLESCLERCKKIDELTTTLYRQERLGIVPSLRPVERLLAKWRRSPLSIKLDMPDETSEYAQSLYIEGTHDNKLGVLPRRGLLGLPPTLGYFPVKWSVTFYKAKNLITDFGPQRMLERTLEKVHLARSEKIPGQIVAYKGVVELEVSGQLVHHIEIVNPVHPSFRHAKQDLYIDMKLQIPAGTHLWTKIDQLDAMYLYAEMNLSPSLTDEDFKIHLPKKKSKKGKSTTRPAKASEK
jgi:hypothetical protein